MRPEPSSSKSVRSETRRDRVAELALHGARVLLRLPAAVAGALVLEVEAKAGHRRRTLPATARRVKGRRCYAVGRTCGSGSSATTSTVRSGSTASSGPSGSASILGYLGRRRRAPAGGRRGRPALARARPRPGAGSRPRLPPCRGRPQRDPAQGPLRQRHPRRGSRSCASGTSTSPWASASDAAASTRGSSCAATPARGDGSRRSISTSASPPASDSCRSRCWHAPASSRPCPTGSPAWWAATSTTGARSCSPSSKRELGFRSANGGDSGAERRIKTYPSFFAQGPLDRIYFRGAFRLLAARPCRLGLCRVASDHLPLVVDFEL